MLTVAVIEDAANAIYWANLAIDRLETVIHDYEVPCYIHDIIKQLRNETIRLRTLDDLHDGLIIKGGVLSWLKMRRIGRQLEAQTEIVMKIIKQSSDFIMKY